MSMLRRQFLFGGGAALTLLRADEQTKGEKLAPYFPTPLTIVEQMLKLGELKPGEKVYDLGSGDGRIVVMAAQKFKADATGVELDEDLVYRSRQAIKKAGIENRAHIIQGDMLKQDYSAADLVTVYLLPVATKMLSPILERQLKKGARVVAHDFQFLEWKPDRVVDLEDDGEGRSRTLYLYRMK